MNRKNLFIFSTLALLIGFIVLTLTFTAGKEEEAEESALANQGALVRMHSPTFGPTTAPVTIVEFLDPACETCRAFYPRIKALMAQHPDKIRLVLRYAPLHPGSDAVVVMLEAARQQGKFWPTLESLLVTQDQWTVNHRVDVARVWKHIEKLDLNLDQLQIDMASPEVARAVAQDVEDARTLNVTKTPEFFVNGKPLPRFGWEPLQTLVDEALNNAARK